MRLAHWVRLGIITAISLLCISLQVESSEPSKRAVSSAKTQRTLFGFRRGRQSKRKRPPGFFTLLNQFVSETVNDTSIAYRNISVIFTEQFRGGNSSQNQMEGGNSTMSNSTRPAFSMKQVFDLLGRNYRGLVKLFNSELRNAITDSNKNVARYRQEFTEAVTP
ncbi:hypothetical protein LSTR_LSTR009752 [Laodelphax striatellus]|uniref:Uncharacterized protein n=1 Tax=Laodelphax striatellus TaxID=195883 RepID=A0A482WI64_LAOST|nr:hypothetical protein LSTR_LSTR009752 [Laodelphax striatellus]